MHQSIQLLNSKTLDFDSILKLKFYLDSISLDPFYIILTCSNLRKLGVNIDSELIEDVLVDIDIESDKRSSKF